ncbi:capsid maturation protease [Rhodococcus phage NiceHouse]|nr:capsid maturation protease [Rhodococcus phage NiceHouse]
MNNMQKFLENGQKANKLNVPVDIQKDSEHQRLVIGFATLDNVDLTNDVITAEASQKAFENFRGNVRLMHDKLRPVGKVVDFAPATYFDPETQKEYQGIQVAVSVSESEPGVWQKCLDGTLSGFSIGGSVRETAPEFREDIGKTVQVIKDYQLTELSLVDSPANHLANVHTIYKSIDGDQSTDSPMGMYGKIQKVLEIQTKGDFPQMADEINKNADPAEVSEVEVTEDAVVEPVAEEVQEAPAAEEPKAEAKPSLEQVLADLSAQIAGQNESVAKSVGETVSLQLEDVKKEFDSRFSALEDAQKQFDAPLSELKQKIADIEAGLKSTEKRLDAVTNNSSIKKSLDAANEPVLEPTDEEPFIGVFSGKYV